MKHFLTILFAFIAYGVSGQNLALKTNLLYDATATVNLGVEFGLGERTTLDVAGNYNAWYTDEALNHKIRHWLIQPEFRYYLCERMNGHFFGLHGLAAEYNVAGEEWLLGLFKEASTLRDIDESGLRCQGAAYGAGVAYGYACPLGARWNLEFSLGAGYIHFDYDAYGESKCDPYIDSRSKDYFGLTKLGISLVYIIK